MIDMRVAQDDSVDVADRDRERIMILLLGLLPALDQSAFEQDSVPTRPNDVQRTRDVARRARKLDFCAQRMSSKSTHFPALICGIPGAIVTVSGKKTVNRHDSD